MRVVVDLNRCQGYAQCCFLAPESFKLVGEEALMYDPGPDDSQMRKIERAAAACPVQAIRFELTSFHAAQQTNKTSQDQGGQHG